MSCDFHASRTVGAIRKVCRCEQCGTPIRVGSPAVRHAGRYCGDFYAQVVHVECDAAALAYARLHDLWGEDFPSFRNDEHYREDEEWMLENYPVVADRLGWEAGEAVRRG